MLLEERDAQIQEMQMQLDELQSPVQDSEEEESIGRHIEQMRGKLSQVQKQVNEAAFSPKVTP